MAEKYYSILTNRGKELEAQSSATGKPVIIKDFVVGDGNGQPVKPDPAQTKLVREVYRNAISALQVSPDQANQFIAQLVLATGVGGFVVREVGLLTDAGELYSVANCAAIEKPENGVSVNLQYRLAVSETASIELKVATGDGLFLRQDANLSDVKDVVQSRKSLGLKGAAVLDVGKVANTVAAGDDTRIVNALQKSNNLSDLTDKAKSRTALELKTAATKDVTTQYDDTNGGRLMTLGCRGIGGSSGDMLPGADINTAAKYLQFLGQYGGGIYRPIWNSAVTNPDGLTKYSVNFFGNTGDTFGLISIDYNSGKTIVVGANQAGIDAGRVYVNELYGKLNKPTPSEIGAVAKTGDTMTGRLIVNFDGEAIRLQPKTAGYASYLISVDSANVNHWYVGAGSTNNADVVFNNYKGGNNSVNLKSDGSINITATSGKNVNITGQVIPSSYVNFDARYVLTDGATYAGFVSGDAAQPYLRHRVSNNVVKLAKTGDSYTKTESDGRFQPKGNYTPAGQAYTKAESDARYVQGVQLGAQSLSLSADASGGSLYLPAGCVSTGYTSPGSSNANAVRFYYKPIQRNINGTWVTITG
ncbi:TPA: phage tail protein [Enterobacter cloacae]